jgi:hypothetical protein
MNKSISINKIFTDYINDYYKQYGGTVSFEQKKVITAIINCRTPILGYRIHECDTCKTKFTLYNSCRNRHCPQCQNLKKEKWLLTRKSEILPVDYHHIVFTLPEELSNIIFYNQKELLSILFKSASETLKTLSKDNKFLGADTGFIMILHTWGQKLFFHPHIHCLIPAGGLNKNKTKWINTPYKKFFMPVQVISDLFKKKFIAKFKFHHKNIHEFYFNKSFNYLNNLNEFYKFANSILNKKWVVFCSKPYNKPDNAIDYFGNYAYKIAISNYRIIKVENNHVHFFWKDYAHNNRIKPTSLNIVEFIRRFLLHVLPNGFQKIRYYGILANNIKQRTISIVRKLFHSENNPAVEFITSILSKSNNELLFYLKAINVNKCPNCENGNLLLRQISLPRSKSNFNYYIDTS